MTDTTAHSFICPNCPHAESACAGACRCTIDGKDIADHIAARQCPKGRFDGVCFICGRADHDETNCTFQIQFGPLVERPSLLGPGHLVTVVLQKIGYAMVESCGCVAFARKMDAWGWKGCLTIHRREVIDWFTAKASEGGLNVDGRVWSLIRAGFKDLLSRRSNRM